VASSVMLSIRDIHYRYGDAEVLKNVSVTVNSGEVVTIIGANGAGKTTLLKVISGLYQPVSGNITFNGMDTVGKPAYEIRRLGLVHVPEGRGILGNLTVYENLLMGAFHEEKKERVRRIEEIYEKFPLLRERQAQVAGSLSGGEQEILTIARGIVGKPRMMMLDEPSLGLAPIMVDLIFSILKDLKEMGLTVLLVEQNATQALDIAERAYVMEVGEIVAEGTIDKILTNKQIV
jgi:branched-chain amino acid transport system ATP-binding protein